VCRVHTVNVSVDSNHRTCTPLICEDNIFLVLISPSLLGFLVLPHLWHLVTYPLQTYHYYKTDSNSEPDITIMLILNHIH